jgi:hypothetical protein
LIRDLLNPAIFFLYIHQKVQPLTAVAAGPVIGNADHWIVERQQCWVLVSQEDAAADTNPIFQLHRIKFLNKKTNIFKWSN